MGTLDGLRGVAKTLLDTFGTAVTITQKSPGAYDTEAGTQTVTEPATAAVNGRIDDPTENDQTVLRDAAQPVVTITGVLTVPAIDVSFVPDTGDTVTHGSDVYRVTKTMTTYGTDQAVIYRIGLSRNA